MRHIRTLIAAIVVAPLAWVLLALGQERSANAFAGTSHGSALRPDDFLRPLLLLAAAGLLLGILGTLRFSPLGAAVIGVLYASSYTMLLVAPSRVVDLFSDDVWVAGRHLDLAAPIRTGTTMVLGVLLLIGAVSGQRWRSWPRPAGSAPEKAPAEDRPVGIDGLGLRDPNRDAEPEPAARYRTAPAPHANVPEPYANAPEPYESDTWPDAPNGPTPHRLTSATQAPYWR
ncbi:hypothetical protein [Dactylosporangium sp. NPDC049140]|uniref:hypothetical protein n=1 Tax=Dactylosporangium sp. NPDC049140 TaxID=3155647 RepID=UPI0033C62E48